MSVLVAGIDGGQTSTVAVIADESGRILGRGVAGPADEIGARSDSTRLRDALGEALADACRAAGISNDANFTAIVAGISGYDGQVYGRPPDLPSGRVVLVHDTPIAHAGALGANAGIVAIAGTGSVVYGRSDDGRSWTLGGWGYLFGDEGSAFGIARDALAMLMRAHDDADRTLGEETRAACEFFETASLRRLAHAFYKGGISRDHLAAFARIAMRFPAFAPVVERGAQRLARLIAAAAAAGAPERVAFVGGVFTDHTFRARVSDGVLRALPKAAIVEARYEPAAGAVLLAYRELGLGVGELRR
jgi:N-acetylglucosamine kinase-like BadF-type ATPase